MRAQRDTVIGWALLVTAVVIVAAGVVGLIWFPIPHGAGFWERLLHFPVFVSGPIAVAVGRSGVRALRRRSTADGAAIDD
ncbi:hypothetical protein ACFRFH_09635 [Leifsonia sp. NPDC056824]|uniref:hypothetical protein n=1 Tax=Leifsonia sp. NPDC056824 TaxID=3345953 RepID=UPI0036CC5096